MGSARKTPRTPNPMAGSASVRGTTMMTFRSSEKKIAYRAFPRAWKVVWPLNWKAMNTKPKK